jgi:choline dehydrogenase
MVCCSRDLTCNTRINSATTLNYEYIVVGSGAGGGPLAARLALAGHKTLLIEAGTDQGSNPNYQVPAYEAKSTQDPALAWDFFVKYVRTLFGIRSSAHAQ